VELSDGTPPHEEKRHMSKNLRGNFKWLAGWTVGMSLLSACGAPADEVQTDAQLLESASELAARDVAVSVSADQATFGAGEAVAVKLSLTNVSRHPVRLLKWYTPADGLEEALLKVSREGEEVAFIGPHYKRPAEQAADFLTLAPGESLTRTVELSGLYDLSKTGSYTLRFDVESSRLHGSLLRTGQVKSNDVSVWVEGRSSNTQETDVTTQVTSSISFTGRCDATQQSTLLNAVNAASAMADDSVAYLGGTAPSGTPRYSTWFGAFSSSGWNQAQTQFIAIKDGFDTKPLTLDCSCKKSYYAYVYPTKPYVIYVCNAFWNAPMTGTDSKGGTLVHEMSHFTVVADTDDHAYGHTNCKNLAKSNPSLALNNADSHEYFAENTPVLQ
jgi:peptidyl-Lys metalloendopeptidase